MQERERGKPNEKDAQENDGVQNIKNVFKSFANLESKTLRRSKRIQNQENKVCSFFTSFNPELDFQLSNPLAYVFKTFNEVHAFR